MLGLEPSRHFSDSIIGQKTFCMSACPILHDMPVLPHLHAGDVFLTPHHIPTSSIFWCTLRNLHLLPAPEDTLDTRVCTLSTAYRRKIIGTGDYFAFWLTLRRLGETADSNVCMERQNYQPCSCQIFR
ncbi:hypothetical protein RvY_08914 [Ramazzottius varieornatus]|uniref:Uncharacterized protein n=1 Tax=Ramazzottius varieornatus TaxID=947166 RepID=A0A1D1V7N0_RAMVA|nr:hypothetical protein RvY_08914 [Ramazzottius varieornatus]